MQRTTLAIGIVATAVATGCHHDTGTGLPLALRAACPEAEVWNGTACVARGGGEAALATGKQQLATSDLDGAKATLAGVVGPLAYAAHVALWEQRGIVAAYLDDEAGARAAFTTLLALDPGHFLSYTLSPKATFVFEKVRAAGVPAPALDVNWASGQRVGDPVPLAIEVLADPKAYLHGATLYVRTRGETAWRAADLTLDPSKPQRVVLPAIHRETPTSLELYLTAYDDHRDEVLLWADAKRPREIPLRYDAPTPWYRRWYTIAIAGTVAALATGVIVYETTLAPPDKVSGSSTSH